MTRVLSVASLAALTAVGTGVPGLPTPSVSAAGAALTPLTPARLLETRIGTGLTTIDHLAEGTGEIAAGGTFELRVLGRGGVPDDASAVMLNVTAVTPAGPGFVTVYPCGSARPEASNLNYGPFEVVPNAVLAKVGDGGKVCLFSLARTHLVVDVNGYVPAGGMLVPFTPARLLETRVGPGLVTIDHSEEGVGALSARSIYHLPVAGRSEVPGDASAVVLNVTAVFPDDAGFITVFPCGEPVPLASNVNYARGDVVANAVLAKIGTGGKVCLYSLASTHVVVDVSGYVPAAGPTVSAVFHAPNHSSATVRLNGANDVTATVESVAGDAYDAAPFTFPGSVPDGTPYSVTVAPPPGQVCDVYAGASGVTPVAADTIKVGCEWRYEHVSHNQDLSVLSAEWYRTAPQIGGADSAVGATGVAYGEGRFVAFVSSAAGLSPNGAWQVFWYDRFTGDLRIVSADASGNAGNANSDNPAISADGLTVVFQSRATNLDGVDTNGRPDIFLWTAQPTVTVPTTIQRISEGPGGVESNGDSDYPTVSGDGLIVAFQSAATNIGGVNGVGGPNVFRRDMATGTNTMVSVSASDFKGAGGMAPAISENGLRIAYWSFSAAIDPSDANGLWDIFVYDVGNPTQRRISKRADGGERAQGNDSSSRVVWPSLSGDGRFATFVTTSPNVVPGDTNDAQDVFVVDLDGALGTRRASVAADGAQGDGDSPQLQGDRVAISHDGRWVAFTSRAMNFGTTTTVTGGTNMFVKDLMTGAIRPFTDSTYGADTPTISRTGTYIAFGAGIALDVRFPNRTGVFVAYTGNGKAFWWV